MITKFRISLKSARVNARLTQNEVRSKLTAVMGIPVSRNRIIDFEKHPEKVPRVYGEKLAEIYKIPIDYISFEPLST